MSVSRFGLVAVFILTTVLLTRVTSGDDLGLWFATVAFGMIATQILQLGVLPAVVREIGTLTHDPRPAIYSAARLIAIAFALFSMSVLIAAHFATDWAPLIEPTLLISYVGIVLAQRVLSEVARGLHDIIGATLLSGIVDKCIFLGFLASIAISNGTINYKSLLLASALITGLSTVFLMPRVITRIGHQAQGLLAGPSVTLRHTWKLWLNSTLTIVLAQGDVLLVAVFLGTSEAGIYGVAWRVAAGVSIPLQVVNATAPHRLSYLLKHGNDTDVPRLATSLATLATYASLLMLLLLAIATPTLIPSIFDVNADLLAVPMLVLALGQLINSAAGPAGLVLIASRHDGAVLWSSVGATIVLVAGIVSLGTSYGLVGAATASALSVVISNGGRTLAIRRSLGIRTDGFHLWNTESVRAGIQLGQLPVQKHSPTP